MAKIRRTIISEIYLALKSSWFSVMDFKVELEETNAFVHITFIPFPEYTFEITEKDVSSRSITNMLNPAGYIPAWTGKLRCCSCNVNGWYWFRNDTSANWYAWN